MKRNSLPSFKNDKKRLQRNVVDCYSKLDKMSDNSKRVKDLFKPKVKQIRELVKEQCETLLLDDSLRSGKKAIEILWRYCYHSFMQFYKKHKRTIKTDEYDLLVSHFQSGTGYFYSILLKLSLDFGEFSGLTKCVPELNLDNFEDDDNNQSTTNKRPDSYTLSIAKQCIHRILICLGDLYRYLENLGKEDCRLLAIKWYNAAIIFDEEHGMPFNQLGSLAGADNYNLDSVYFYIRSLNCKKPFDSAEDNLKYIFNLSKSQINEISIQDRSSNSECVFLVKKCLIEFIHLVNLLWFESDDLMQLEKFINTTLNAFNQAIQLKFKPTNARKPTYLCPETVFQLTVIVIILNQKFKIKSFEGDKLSSTLNSATVGFTLNFLFYLINAIIKQIREKNIVDKSVIKENKPNGFSGIKENGYTKKSFLHQLRRKTNFRMSNENDDILSNLLDEDDDDDLNELEETALSTIDALEMSSDMSETGSLCEDEEEEEDDESIFTTSEDEGSSQHNSNNSYSNKNVLTTYEVGRFLSYLYNESILPSIKVLLDWLTVNEHLFSTYYQAFDSLFGNFVDLLNLLLELEEKALRSNDILNKFKYTSFTWKQIYPLSVDISVSNLDTFKDYHKNHLDFNNQLNCNLTDEENGFLCLQSIVSFGHHISGNLSKYKIEFNSTLNKFSLANKNNEFQINGFKTEKQLTSNDPLTILENGFDFGSSEFMKNNFSLIGDFAEQMSNDIIPNVSHLWLDNPTVTKENGLDKSTNSRKSTLLNSTNQSNKFLPYILFDSTAYSCYLNLVKELFLSREFMIVVPKIVLQELDKKQKNSYDSYESKDAFKWIKNERQKSTKFLRFLKTDERLRVNIQYPLKQEKTAYDFHILLEHCNYLNRKNIAKYNENGLANGQHDKIIFLYGKNNCFPVNYENLLDKIAVRSDSITNFVKNFRLTSNSKNG